MTYDWYRRIDDIAPDYLYHYTTVDTLALILKNKTIRFNCLNRMDDLLESKTKDLNNYGDFYFISSWTSEIEESIPIWKMYARLGSGVRIRLRSDPFKRYDNELAENAIKLYFLFPKCEKKKFIVRNTRAGTDPIKFYTWNQKKGPCPLVGTTKK